jgi:hypothetical protein
VLFVADSSFLGDKSIQHFGITLQILNIHQHDGYSTVCTDHGEIAHTQQISRKLLSIFKTRTDRFPDGANGGPVWSN